MNRLLARFAQLPRSTQFGILIGVGVVLIGGLVLFGSAKAVAAFVAGLALIGLALVAYDHFSNRVSSRQLDPLEQAIKTNTATTFVAISEPARRARLDDLRKNFESGVQKFRDAGKNLYSLPWYLVVGEPGSGKTEAIRHCNVGFPPGLQDQLQGAGGTLNMNWWFTNHAVMLDTAGRLMFEEVEPGTTSEWQEFLKLLRRSRPNCPVNGMLLVIPSESLIRDSAEAIEQKGSKIAQQLDQIQRAIGVRFPVYVVVTKCDLINGFREFFDQINDPQLQHQIFGWSNPAPLDTPFNPELVDQHLLSVKRRLLRRRLGLLLDPVNADDPRQPRTPQVDSLYEFPDCFMDIAPRLKRYLSMIFVAGEWSARPLFLRGIYFTSSMREGEALDSKLAEALGVPVESLPEGKVWERDRSFFLRDLFMGKVFREKGLVTRAVNTSKQQAARQGLIFGTAGVGLAVLAGLSFLGHRSMETTMIGPTAFWSSLASAATAGLEPADAAAGLSARTLPIVAPNSKGSTEFFYRAAPDAKDPLLAGLPIPDENKTRARIHQEARARAEERLPVPWVYAPMAMLGGESDRDIARSARVEAARSLFESGIVRTLLDAARTRLKSTIADNRPWNTDCTDALAQLLKAQILAVSGKGALPKIDPLLKLALQTNDGYTAGGASKDGADLDALVQGYFAADAPGAATLKPTPVPITELNAAADAFLKSLDTPPPESPLAGVTRLAQALNAFDAAEKSLHNIDVGKPAPDWISDWQSRVAALADAKQKVDAAFPILDNRSIAKAYADELTKHREARGKDVQRLADELKSLDPSEHGASATDSARLADLRKLRDTLASGKERLQTATREQTDLVLSFARLDASGIGDPGHPAYQTRYAVYARINDRFTSAAAKPEDARAALAAIDTDLAADLRIIDEELRERLAASRESIDANNVAAAARAVARKAATLAADVRRAGAMSGLASTLPASAEAIAATVVKLAEPAAALPVAPMFRFAPTIDDPRFNPKAAGRVLADFAAARNALKPAAGGGAGNPPDSVRAAGQAASEYAAQYLAHWTTGLAESVQVVSPLTYPQAHAQLAAAPQFTVILEPLAALQARAQDAIEQIAPHIDTADRALTSKLESARRSLATARSAIDSPEFRQLCSGVFVRWKSLPDNPDEARRTVAASAVGPTPMQPYYIRAASDDFVRRSWQNLTVAWLKSLAAASASPNSNSATQPAQSLKVFDRFPLNRAEPSAKPLRMAEFAAARAAVASVPAAASGPQASSACDQPISDDPSINEAARALLGCGAAASPTAATDPAALARMRRMLDALPADPAKAACRVSLLTDRPAKAGARPITSITYLRMLIAAADGTPPRGKSIPTRAGEQLGVLPFSAASILIEPRSGAAGESSGGPPFEVPGPWIPLRLIDQFDGAPVPGDLKTWDVEVILSSGPNTYSLWLRLSFDEPLPPAPWFR